MLQLAKCGKVLRAINQDASLEGINVDEEERCEVEPDEKDEKDELECEEIHFEIEKCRQGNTNSKQFSKSRSYFLHFF